MHIITLDGYQYTFNGKGEFILAEAQNGSFIFQGRMTDGSNPANITNRSTNLKALAVKEGNNPVVQLETDNNELVVLVDGDKVDFTEMSEQRFANLTITDIGNSTSVVRYTSGVSISASVSYNRLTNVLVTLPESFSTRGLLGQFNGDPQDDLLPRNSSTPLPPNSTNEDIYHDFVKTCKCII